MQGCHFIDVYHRLYTLLWTCISSGLKHCYEDSSFDLSMTGMLGGWLRKSLGCPRKTLSRQCLIFVQLHPGLLTLGYFVVACTLNRRIPSSLQL